ncbi:MAG: preprotein translocase subunit SecY [Anaerolineales bacterium]|nr:preprotein translocase subunit SecY [Anaerolineales bacterium]
MIQAVRNAFKLPDLRRRLLITLLVLVVYRLAAHVPVPNVDPVALRRVFDANQLLGLLDLMSGGAMSSFSVMAMGVYPYITATIVMQLLQPIIPRLEAIAQEGEAGRNRLNRYTYYMAIPLSALQAYTQAQLLQSQGVITNFGLSGAMMLPTIATVCTLTAGTMFAIWLGELITEQGIGNGLSVIIFGGIVAQIPQRVGALLVGDVRGLIAFLIIMVVTVAVIVIVQEGQRRIPVQYGKRVLAMRGGRLRVAGGQSTHVPLRVNAAGMIPLIFAQSLLMLPGVVASYLVSAQNQTVSSIANIIYQTFSGQGNVYYIMYFLMVIGFTYFYTDMVFQQQNLPDNLKRQGGFIPGIRPGKRTADYLNGVMRRITLVGALFLGLVAVLPWIVGLLGIVENPGMMLITSSGLLIVVGVVLDTMKQLEAQLLMRHYEGFIR